MNKRISELKLNTNNDLKCFEENFEGQLELTNNNVQNLFA